MSDLNVKQILFCVFFLVLLISQGYSNAISKLPGPPLQMSMGVFGAIFAFCFSILAIRLQNLPDFFVPITPFIGGCFILGSSTTLIRAESIGTLDSAAPFAIIGIGFGLGILTGGILKIRKLNSEKNSNKG